MYVFLTCSLCCIRMRLAKFLDYKFSQSPPNETQTTRNKYIKLPFYGHLNYTIRKSLTTIFKTQCPDIKFIFIFTNTFTIASFFKFKDSIPVGLISNIIYEFTCSRCKARYIGETKRNLTQNQ